MAIYFCQPHNASDSVGPVGVCPRPIQPDRGEGALSRLRWSAPFRFVSLGGAVVVGPPSEIIWEGFEAKIRNTDEARDAGTSGDRHERWRGDPHQKERSSCNPQCPNPTRRVSSGEGTLAHEWARALPKWKKEMGGWKGEMIRIHKISLMWETEPHCIFEKIIEQGLPYTVDPQKPHRDYRRMFKMST